MRSSLSLKATGNKSSRTTSFLITSLYAEVLHRACRIAPDGTRIEGDEPSISEKNEEEIEALDS
jgi:hypothetical protein